MTCTLRPDFAPRAATLTLGVALLLALATRPAVAQRPITLAEAMQRAATQAPLAQLAAGVRESARGRARVDGTLPNPVLEYRRENDQTPLQPDIFVTATLPLDLTGRRFGLRAAGEAHVERAGADSATLVRDAVLEAARGWWRAALARELLAIAREQEAALEGIAAFDATRLREGSVAPVIALRARLEADRARLARVAAEADAARALGELARAIGMRGDSVLVPAPLDAARLAAPPAALPATDSLVRTALTQRPELRARGWAVTEAERRLGAERRGVLGDVSLIGGTKRTSGFDGIVFGAALPFPLFSVNGGARQKAQGDLMQAQAELRDAAARVAADVMATRTALAAQQGAAGIRPDSLAARGAEVATIAEAAYREGALSQLELLEARKASAEARAAALRWLVDQQLTRLDFKRAIGAPVMEAQP